MVPADEDFLRSLRATFKVEAAEHLQAISTGLLELEKRPEGAGQQPLIETVYRAAHSLKGAARAVDFTDIESLCQSLENLFAAWKRGQGTPTQEALDQAHRAVDQMTASMSATAPAAQAAAPTKRQRAAERPEPIPPPTSPATPPRAIAAPESDTVRISVGSLDARLLEAEELLTAKLAASQRAVDIAAMSGEFEQWHEHWDKVQSQARVLRRAMERANGHAGFLPNLAELAEFFDWNQDYVRSMENKLLALRRSAEQDRLTVGKLVDDLLENSKKLLMLPLATLGGLLPKLVRDLSRDQGKEVELTIHGDDVKMDKRILEELKDPLVHLLRNCIDHGVEKPEARRAAGKPARASLVLTVAQVNGNQVELVVADDGAGIDVDKVKRAAVDRGLLTTESAARLGDEEARALVFEADVSTSPMITQLSGRGLGLAIVREKTEKLGGRVVLESRRGAGTSFRMTLPLTLATFRGVLLECAQRRFIVPTSQVERVTRFRPQDVRTVEGRNTLTLNERAISLADLAEVLQLPPARRATEASEAIPAIVLGSGEHRMAFAVDAVLDEREVLVKRLARPLSRVRNIAGATILGSGEVAPILNVSDVLKSARFSGTKLRAQTPAQAPAVAAQRVLIAEDSITSRMLLKGLLEAAGYEVKTAVDGVEAFTALRAERFDLVVSDVEMPRMNGFDLTARIRAERALAGLPVVLVTALESREDRERGIDVGANAYLVKSSLDQSNLLEAVRRLA
jgi:two-component system chemotaxis sensor kinase CheA